MNIVSSASISFPIFSLTIFLYNPCNLSWRISKVILMSRQISVLTLQRKAGILKNSLRNFNSKNHPPFSLLLSFGESVCLTR